MTNTQSLTVINYAIREAKKAPDGSILKTRVTVSPGMVSFIIGSYDTYVKVEDVELRKVNVVMHDGNQLELFISLLDMNLLESVVGFFAMS